MKIGFLSIRDASRPTSASLHSFYEAKAFIDQGLEVHFLSPLVEKKSINLYLRRLLSRTLARKRFLPDREHQVLEDYARQIRRRLRQTPVDIILSHGTIPISLLDCPTPIVFWSDSTFAGMVGFYPGFTDLHPGSIAAGNRMEQEALSRAVLAFYSSEWAANTCRENYAVDAAKVQVVGYGPNLEREKPLSEVREMIQGRPREKCKLVFSGMEWKRKGGDWAIRLVGELNKHGLPTELTVIGCSPPKAGPRPDYVRWIGYLNNATPAGQLEYQNLLAESHFLVLPARADCSPRVLHEANALGVPCITTNVGGIPSTITEGTNGCMFPPTDEFVQRAANYVLETFCSDTKYNRLASKTIRHHKENHTWEKSAQAIMKAIEERIGQSSNGRQTAARWKQMRPTNEKRTQDPSF